MSNRKNNGNEICMLCGAWKEEKSLICRKCFNLWLTEWEKDEEIALVVWTFQKAKICCSSIDKRLETIRRMFSTFQTSIKEDAYKKVNQALMGIKVSDFAEMLETKRQKLWKERDGDKQFGQLKRLETCAQKLPGFVEELKTKIEEYKKEEKKEEQKKQEKE